MSEVSTEPMVKELSIPFDSDDEQVFELIKEMADNTKKIAETKQDLAAVKDELKGFEEAYSAAAAKLAAGKVREVDCTKTIDWDANTVVITRDDTGEVIQEREIEEDDKQVGMRLAS